jgi:hypothetical protein
MWDKIFNIKAGGTQNNHHAFKWLMCKTITIQHQNNKYCLIKKMEKIQNFHYIALHYL